MHTLLRSVRDLFWPAACGGCGHPGPVVCPGCAADVAALGSLRRHHPTPCPDGFPPTVVWGSYAGALKRLVLAYKDAGRADLTGLLATLLADVVEEVMGPLSAPVIVPVPSAAAARRLRGREPVTDLVRGMRLARPAWVAPVLRVRRAVRDQAGLDHRARAANLAGSFTVVPGGRDLVAGRSVVVIDDVVTTGATLTEAARALRREAAAGSVHSAVLCATQRRGGRVGSHAAPGLPTGGVLH